jgi:hypothetical protein
MKMKRARFYFSCRGYRHLWWAMLTLLPGLAYADDGLPDRLVISAGPYYVRNSSTTAAYSPAGVPLSVAVNFNRDLGLDESDGSYRIDGYYRFAEKHRLDFAWYRVNRTGTATIREDFSWNDQDYFAGWTVESRSKNQTIKLNYLYSFYRSQQTELGLGLGLHITNLSSGVAVTSFNNILPPNPDDYVGEAALKTVAPLPVVSALVSYYITPRWRVVWNYDVFYLDYSGIRGDFSDSNIAVEYQAFRHLGVGIGYNRVEFDLEGKDNGDRYNLTTRYEAARFYFKGYF